MPRGFDGEQGDLVRPDMVGIARRLANGIMCHYGDRLEGTQVSDETADDFVEGRVDEKGAVGSCFGISDVTVAEQPRGAGAQGGKGVSELGRASAVRCPGGGDDAVSAPAAWCCASMPPARRLSSSGCANTLISEGMDEWFMAKSAPRSSRWEGDQTIGGRPAAVSR